MISPTGRSTEACRASTHRSSPRAAITTKSASRRVREPSGQSSPAFYIATRDELAVLAELQRTRGRAEYRRDRAPRHRARCRRGLGRRLLRSGGIHLHPRRGRSGVPDLRGNAVSAGDGRSRAATCPQFRAMTSMSVLTWTYAPLGFSTTAGGAGRAPEFMPTTATRPSLRDTGRPIGGPALTQHTARWQFSEYLRVDNLTDRTYVGSVIVNQSSAEYYEAAPGRTALVMFNAKWRID